MKKSIKIIIAVLIIIVIAVIVLAFTMNKNEETSLVQVSTSEDLKELIEQIYEGQQIKTPTLETREIEISDSSSVKFLTGLESGEKFEFLVVSEPIISPSPYSFVLAKVKSDVDANEVAKEMSENVNPRKWISVAAQRIYATSSGDVVCLIMASEENAKLVYERFKEVAGNIGEEYTKTLEDVKMDSNLLIMPVPVQ